MEAAVAERTRLCWNCEGHVPPHEENCTYCGVYIGEAEKVQHSSSFRAPPPPYKISGQNRESTPPPYTSEVNATDNVTESGEANSGNYPAKQLVMTMSLILSGSVLLLFGIALTLFAIHDTLTLQWDATYWWGYLVAAALLLAFGWRQLHFLED